MNKFTIFLGLITLASLGTSASLWLASDSTSSARVAELETKLREAEATIARLQKQRPSTSASTKLSTANTTVPLNDSLPSPAAPSSGDASPSAPQATTLPAATAPATIAPATTDPRKLKSLAEAEARYSDLINQFQLQPDEKEFFKQLAAKRSEIRRQITSKLQDPSLTPGQRQTLLAQAKAELDQNDGEIRQFLNNDSDFSNFAVWEQTEIERGQMESGRAIFENNGQNLSPDQEDWLVKAAYSLRHDTKGVADPFHLESLVGTRVDQAYVQNVLQKFDRDTQVLLQNARGRFSVPQIDSINAWRTQQRVQVEARLWNMSRTTGTAQ